MVLFCVVLSDKQKKVVFLTFLSEKTKREKEEEEEEEDSFEKNKRRRRNFCFFRLKKTHTNFTQTHRI